MKRSLTGIKPTGMPHLGNILGAILPAIQLQKNYESFYFIANLHALTGDKDAERLRRDTLEVAAVWLALGFDPTQGSLFIQSHVPEVTELSWILSCCVSLGDLFRAHAFKAARDKGEEGRLDLGTFSYPVLMAADILLYHAEIVPVGKDQAQHLEMARALAARFNHLFGETLTEPQALISEDVAVVPGIDGRKMSKSYHNGIEPLRDSKELKKQVMAIVTDSKGLDDPKNPEECHVFALYKLLATPDEIHTMASRYKQGGYGYGHAKLALLEKIEQHFGPARERYRDLCAHPEKINLVLNQGAAKARLQAQVTLEQAKKASGIL